MKHLTRLGLLLGFALLASLPFALGNGKSHPAAHCKIIPLTATIIGNFNYLAEGGPAWVGHAIVRFGDEMVKVATFVDRGDGLPQVREDGSIYGTETISLRFVDGSGSFEIDCRFEGTPASTPSLFILHETGTIANGTGDYEGISGAVSVHGPFLSPDPGVNPTALEVSPPWIGEMRGKVSGLEIP